jgi:hypothetical protein
MSRYLLLLVFLAVGACSPASEQIPVADSSPAVVAAVAEKPAGAVVVPTEAKQSAPLGESTLAGLAAADARDGTTDHVVAMCAGCRLMMDGKAEHSLEVGDYTLHLCSSGCRDHFVQDMDAGLERLIAAASPAAEF